MFIITGVCSIFQNWFSGQSIVAEILSLCNNNKGEEVFIHYVNSNHFERIMNLTFIRQQIFKEFNTNKLDILNRIESDDSKIVINPEGTLSNDGITIDGHSFSFFFLKFS